MEYNLNPQQKAAVTTTSRYVRVIAGAGSGKTRVLTTRVVHLIREWGVDPKRIVAITFTNKAAREMKKRIEESLGEEGRLPWISTIHSLCVRILREDIHVIGYPKGFAVMDESDQKSILRQAYRQRGIDSKNMPYASMLDYISHNKFARITPQEAEARAKGYPPHREKARVYGMYCARQEEIGALDFDDLLIKAVDLLKEHGELAEKWRKRFQYILVDEFQDIDDTQYDLIRILAGRDNDVYVVGDPDQTIYTWRGANVQIIMDFSRQFSPCETIYLTQNYRSSPVILQAANSLITHNRNRLEKDLFTRKASGEKIVHYAAAQSEEEADWIARKIAQLHHGGLPYSQTAVLYRANYLSRALEKGMRDHQIPYVVFGGLRFYDRAEIKDMLSYLRMLESADDLAMRRVVNTPRRGIGDKTMDALYALSQQHRCTMYQAIGKMEDSPAKKKLEKFRSLIEKLKKDTESMPLDQILEMAFEETGYRKMLEDLKEEDREANVRELMNDMKDFQEEDPSADLSEYLQMVSLYTDRDEDQSADCAQLMTVHAAKGLEFDTVFLAGFSEGVFPSEKTMAEGEKGLEEERRLAYVAITRAKERLYLTEARDFSYVLQQGLVPSRFLKEIDPDTISEQGMAPGRVIEKMAERPVVLPQRKRPERYRPGDLVTHAVFGDGIVVKIEGSLMDVAFARPYGVKKLMMGHPSVAHKK